MELHFSAAKELREKAGAYLDSLEIARKSEAEAITFEQNLRRAMKEYEVQVIVLNEDEVIIAEAANNWTSKVKIYGDVIDFVRLD